MMKCLQPAVKDVNLNDWVISVNVTPVYVSDAYM